MTEKIHVLLLRPADEPPPPRSNERLVIAHIPVLDWKPLTENLGNAKRLLESVDWVVFTSFRGVRAALPITEEIVSARKRGTRIAAVGPRTAEEIRRLLGLEPDLVPREFRGAVLAEELAERGARRVLLLRSSQALDEPVRVLRSRGIDVHDIPVYTMIVLERMVEAAVSAAPFFDYVVFTSPSIVRAFFSRWRGGVIRAAAIGPTTARALREYGIKPSIVPREYTLVALLETILERPPL